MAVDDPRIRSLLRQAERTVELGKRAAAEQLYEEIVEEAPASVEAWLGLAEVAGDDARREAAYERVLELEPQNEQAQRALSGLDGTGMAGLVKQPPAPTPQGVLEPPAAPDGSREQRVPAEQTQTQPRPVQATAREAMAEDDGAPLELEKELAEAVAVAPGEEPLFCYRHPSRETGLRCYTCERPICSKCAQRTPVGYRCPQCIREAQDVFFAANALDYLLAGITSLVLGLIAGVIVPYLGFFVIFLAPVAGTLIGRLSFRAARRHRGRLLPYLVAGMVVIGGLLIPAWPLLLSLLTGQLNFAVLSLGRLLFPAIYAFLAAGSAYYQVK